MANNSDYAIEYNRSVAPIISELLNPLFKNFNITTFAHAKIYPQTIFHVTNNQAWFESYCTDALFNSDHYQQEINNLTHDEHFVLRNNQVSCLKSMHRYGLWHALSIYKRYENYIEMWNFATVKENSGIYNFYLNDKEFLDRYITYFKNKAKDIIEPFNKKILFIRKKELVLNNISISTFPEKKHFLDETYLKELNLNGAKINISKREIQCLHLLSQGKSLKEIALTLDISPRTVETYLNQSKFKTKCLFKQDLIKCYNTNFRSYFLSEFNS